MIRQLRLRKLILFRAFGSFDPSEHANYNNHDIAWDDVTILATESRKNKRRWTEAWFISKNSNVLFNRDCGRLLPDVYRPIVTRN